MSKSYSLILNSANTTNQVDVTAGIGGYKYYVNWDVMLPKEIKKFDTSFVFRTTTSVTNPINTLLLSVDFGSRTMYDQSNIMTNIIGAIIPKSYVTGTTPNYYYESNNTDENGFIAYYPTNNYITVKLTNMDGSAMTNFPAGYLLHLSFTEIE